MADITSARVDLAQNAAIVPSTTYYLSLHTGDPVTTGAHEGSDGRQAITFGSSSGGSQASTNAQTWASAVGGATYTFFGVWTAASGGTYLRGGSLTTSITPTAGSQIQAAIGAITFTGS